MFGYDWMSQILIKELMEGLKDLASYDFQKVAWFENDKGLWSSYAEDVEAVFTYTGLEYALDQGETIFGKAADDALMELDRACDSVGYDRNESNLLACNAELFK